MPFLFAIFIEFVLHVLNAMQVSKQEKLLFSSQVGGGNLPLHFTTLEHAFQSPAQLGKLLDRHM